MLYGIYQIQNIINTSHLLFGCPDVDVENLKMLNSYDLRYDYAEMYHMLSEIKEIIDRMIQEGDENKNIDKLMQERNVNQFIDELMQEGEGNEL